MRSSNIYRKLFYNDTLLYNEFFRVVPNLSRVIQTTGQFVYFNFKHPLDVNNSVYLNDPVKASPWYAQYIWYLKKLVTNIYNKNIDPNSPFHDSPSGSGPFIWGNPVIFNEESPMVTISEDSRVKILHSGEEILQPVVIIYQIQDQPLSFRQGFTLKTGLFDEPIYYQVDYMASLNDQMVLANTSKKYRV